MAVLKSKPIIINGVHNIKIWKSAVLASIEKESRQGELVLFTNGSLILIMLVEKGWESNRNSFWGSIAEGIEKGSELKQTSLKDYGCRMQISLLAFSIALARGTLASIPFLWITF